MEQSFRDLVLGLSPREVEETLRNHGLNGRVRVFHPLTALALGLSRKMLLESSDIPARPFRYDLPILFALWFLAAILFFVTVASFFGGPGSSQQAILILATLVLATVALVMTGFAATKSTHPALQVDARLKELPLWALISDPFIGIVATLLALLIIFLLFFLWLPVLLLLLSTLSLGGLWNVYRACLVAAEDDNRLALAGRDLLRRGAVLSRTWDLYLDTTDRRRSTEARKHHLSLHRSFVGVGLSSLVLAIAVLLSRAVPWEGWLAALIPLAGLTAAAFLILFWELRSRLALRRLP